MVHRAMRDLLPSVELEPRGPVTSSIVWMHGLGADGHDFEGVAPLLGLPQTRFVFPHASTRPVTINGGMRMRAWYDIVSFDFEDAREEPDDIAASTEQIFDLLDREIERGVPSERIVLAGFSQGAAMALHAGVRYPHRLAGIIALSGYALLRGQFESEAREHHRETPILLCHGLADNVVPHELGVAAHELMRTWSRASVEWAEFPIGHQVSMPEIETIAAWLQERLR